MLSLQERDNMSSTYMTQADYDDLLKWGKIWGKVVCPDIINLIDNNDPCIYNKRQVGRTWTRTSNPYAILSNREVDV